MALPPMASAASPDTSPHGLHLDRSMAVWMLVNYLLLWVLGAAIGMAALVRCRVRQERRRRERLSLAHDTQARRSGGAAAIARARSSAAAPSSSTFASRLPPSSTSSSHRVDPSSPSFVPSPAPTKEEQQTSTNMNPAEGEGARGERAAAAADDATLASPSPHLFDSRTSSHPPPAPHSTMAPLRSNSFPFPPFSPTSSPPRETPPLAVIGTSDAAPRSPTSFISSLTSFATTHDSPANPLPARQLFSPYHTDSKSNIFAGNPSAAAASDTSTHAPIHATIGDGTSASTPSLPNGTARTATPSSSHSSATSASASSASTNHLSPSEEERDLPSQPAPTPPFPSTPPAYLPPGLLALTVDMRDMVRDAATSFSSMPVLVKCTVVRLLDTATTALAPFSVSSSSRGKSRNGDVSASASSPAKSPDSASFPSMHSVAEDTTTPMTQRFASTHAARAVHEFVPSSTSSTSSATTFGFLWNWRFYVRLAFVVCVVRAVSVVAWSTVLQGAAQAHQLKVNALATSTRTPDVNLSPAKQKNTPPTSLPGASTTSSSPSGMSPADLHREQWRVWVRKLFEGTWRCFAMLLGLHALHVYLCDRHTDAKAEISDAQAEVRAAIAESKHGTPSAAPPLGNSTGSTAGVKGTPNPPPALPAATGNPAVSVLMTCREERWQADAFKFVGAAQVLRAFLMVGVMGLEYGLENQYSSALSARSLMTVLLTETWEAMWGTGTGDGAEVQESRIGGDFDIPFSSNGGNVEKKAAANKIILIVAVLATFVLVALSHYAMRLWRRSCEFHLYRRQESLSDTTPSSQPSLGERLSSLFQYIIHHALLQYFYRFRAWISRFLTELTTTYSPRRIFHFFQQRPFSDPFQPGTLSFGTNSMLYLRFVLLVFMDAVYECAWAVATFALMVGMRRVIIPLAVLHVFLDALVLETDIINFQLPKNFLILTAAQRVQHYVLLGRRLQCMDRRVRHVLSFVAVVACATALGQVRSMGDDGVWMEGIPLRGAYPISLAIPWSDDADGSGPGNGVGAIVGGLAAGGAGSGGMEGGTGISLERNESDSMGAAFFASQSATDTAPSSGSSEAFTPVSGLFDFVNELRALATTADHEQEACPAAIFLSVQPEVFTLADFSIHMKNWWCPSVFESLVSATDTMMSGRLHYSPILPSPLRVDTSHPVQQPSPPTIDSTSSDTPSLSTSEINHNSSETSRNTTGDGSDDKNASNSTSKKDQHKEDAPTSIPTPPPPPPPPARPEPCFGFVTIRFLLTQSLILSNYVWSIVWAFVLFQRLSALNSIYHDNMHFSTTTCALLSLAHLSKCSPSSTAVNVDEGERWYGPSSNRGAGGNTGVKSEGAASVPVVSSNATPAAVSSAALPSGVSNFPPLTSPLFASSPANSASLSTPLSPPVSSSHPEMVPPPPMYPFPQPNPTTCTTTTSTLYAFSDEAIVWQNLLLNATRRNVVAVRLAIFGFNLSQIQITGLAVTMLVNIAGSAQLGSLAVDMLKKLF